MAGAALGRSTLAQMMGGGGGGMGGGGGGGVIDPPVGSVLRDPPVAPNLSTTPGLVDVAIEARVAPASVNGATANLLTYQGSFIAPTIRANPGDVVQLRFRNGLPTTGELNLMGHPRYVTNVHVHGWHVSPGADRMTGLPADDVHLQIAPGGEQVYRYDLARQRPGSIGLYHPHVHGSVAEQYWGGLIGALDVTDGPVTSLAPYPRRVLVLKDITIANGAPAPYTTMSEYMQGKEGSVIMANAQVNPYLPVRPGEVHRLRIVNGSNARFYRLSLQGHTLYLVGTDGGLLAAPYGVTELLLAPGERADVLVKASTKTGDYKLLSLPYARHGSMTSAQITLMTLRVGGAKNAQPLPSIVDPAAAARLADDPMLPRPRFALSMMMGRGYINGQTFEVLADGSISSDTHMSTVGTDEIWEIVNDSGMDHPWHQHVNDGQVLAISGGDSTFAPYAQLHTRIAGWKDTVIVPKWGSVTIRVPIRDYTGMAMYHCHILEHEDIGMMGMWHIMDAGGMGM